MKNTLLVIMFIALVIIMIVGMILSVLNYAKTKWIGIPMFIVSSFIIACLTAWLVYKHEPVVLPAI